MKPHMESLLAEVQRATGIVADGMSHVEKRGLIIEYIGTLKVGDTIRLECPASLGGAKFQTMIAATLMTYIKYGFHPGRKYRTKQQDAGKSLLVTRVQ